MEVGYQLHARTDDVSGHIYRPTEHTGTCNVRELSGLADLASLPGARLEAAAGCSGGATCGASAAPPEPEPGGSRPPKTAAKVAKAGGAAAAGGAGGKTPDSHFLRCAQGSCFATSHGNLGAARAAAAAAAETTVACCCLPDCSADSSTDLSWEDSPASDASSGGGMQDPCEQLQQPLPSPEEERGNALAVEFLDLFAGYGGLGLGLESGVVAGGFPNTSVCAAVDLFSAALQTYRCHTKGADWALHACCCGCCPNRSLKPE